MIIATDGSRGVESFSIIKVANEGGVCNLHGLDVFFNREDFMISVDTDDASIDLICFWYELDFFRL